MKIKENHMASEKHQKFKNKIMESTILDSFTKLSTDSNRQRTEGGTSLLKHLSESQDNEKNEQELNYVLNRLVRGLGSSRVNARTGFYTTLVALLSTSSISYEDIKEIMKKELEKTGSFSKSEKADLYMGQILAVGALIKSGKLTTASQDAQIELIQQLITVGKKRNFLSLCSYSFLISFLDYMSEDIFINNIWPVIKSEVLKPLNEQSLDQVWFLLVAQEKFPQHITNKMLKKNHSEILHTDTMQNVCELLMNVPSIQTLQHPLYKLISTKIAKSRYISDFCEQIQLQLNKYNRNKFIIYMTIITYILEEIEDFTKIPDLFVSNFLQECFRVIPPIKTRKDDEIIVKFHKLLETLNKTLSDSSIDYNIKISVIKKLLFYPGNFMFEKITNSKIIQQITVNLNEKGIKKLAKLCEDIILAKEMKNIGENQKEHWFNVERIQATHFLNRLLNHPTVQNEHEWKCEQVKFLLNIALFNTENNIGIELASVIKESFHRSLDQKFAKLENFQSFLSQLIHYINSQICDEKINNLRNPLSNKALECWNIMIKLVEKLEKKKKKSGIIPVFHTLLLYMGLHLFSNEKIAINAIEELQSCYTRAKSKKKEEELIEGAVENEPLWIEVIIDLILSLLSQEDHLLRSVINYVFPFLCPYLTLSAIHQILHVLDPNNESNPLDDFEEETDGEDNENEEDGKENKSDDETDISDIDDYENEPVNDKLRMAISEALGNSGMQTDEESIDVDDIDEEEGKRLDKALAAVFKSVKTVKNNKKQSKEERILTHFRVRVLDLIELYLNSEPALEIVLEILVPLLQTLEFSIKDLHQKPLELRLRVCFNKLSGLKKFQSLEGVEINKLAELLKSLLIGQNSTNRSILKNMGDVITKCCIFIIRVSVLIPNTKKKKENPIYNVVKDVLCQFFEKRDCLIPSIFFNELLNLAWKANWLLLPLLIQYAFDTNIRPFRRNHALLFLTTFYKNGRLLSTKLSEKVQLKFNKIEQTLIDKTIEFLGNSKENPVKEKFVCRLMILLKAIVNCHKQHKIECIIDWHQIGNVVNNYRSNVSLAKDAKLAYNKLCSAIGISKKVSSINNQQQKLENAQENGLEEKSLGLEERSLDSENRNENDEESANEKKKIKKKRQKAKAMKKETQNLKKQAKLLRNQAMEKDLEDILFSKISNLSEITSDNEEQLAEEQTIKKTKKRKHNDGDISVNNQLSSKKKKRKI